MFHIVMDVDPGGGGWFRRQWMMVQMIWANESNMLQMILDNEPKMVPVFYFFLIVDYNLYWVSKLRSFI